MSITDFTNKLASSGLTLEDAEQLHIEYFTVEQTKHYASWSLSLPSMHFNYYDTNKMLYGLGQGRIRYLGDPPGFLAAAKKPPRFLQRKGARPLPYFPIHDSINWKSVIQNNKIPIYFTEGELKAACLVKNGLPCIGLGGVYNWKSKRLDMPMIPELNELNLENRPVIIVFDADCTKNAQVQKALEHFADQLLNRFGAIPRIIELPIVNYNEKTGADDFIVAKGIDEFGKLPAKEFHQFRSLVNFNERCMYISSTGEFYDLKNSVICKRRHAELTFAVNRIDIRNNKGNYNNYPILNHWLEWPGRSEVQKIIFDPSLPPKEITEEYFNIWKGFPYSPKEGNIDPWLEFLEHLIPRESNREYVKNWISWRFQNPGIKPHTALVFWSNEQGTGKSTLCNILSEIFGEEYSETITPEMLVSAFNPWMIGKLLINVEEISSFGHNDFSNKLKVYLTQKRTMINEKGIRQYTLKDVSSFIFNSNKSNAVYFDSNDRRYYIINSTDKILDYKLGRIVNDWATMQVNKEALMHEFLMRDLKDFDARAPAPMTNAKREMHSVNMSSFENWLYMVGDSEIFENRKFMTANEIAQMYSLHNDDPKPPTARTVGIHMNRYKYKRVGPDKGLYINGMQKVYWCMERGSEEENYSNDEIKEYLKNHVSLEMKF